MPRAGCRNRCGHTLPELARELGHSHIGVEHLFLAIVRDRAAVPAQVLARMTDLDRVEASVREELALRCPWPRIRIQCRRDRAWIIVSEPGNTAEAVASARAQIERG